MADEQEQVTTEEPSQQTPQGDQTPAADESQARTPTGEGQTESPEEKAKRYDELKKKYKDLESKHTKLSQEAEQNKKLLDIIQPVWETEGGQPAAANQAQTSQEDLGVSAGGDDQIYMTRAEHKKEIQQVLSQVNRIINTSNFVTNFRQEFPDLGDKGPKEQLVTHYFNERLKKGEKRENALQSAITDARAFIKSLEEKGAITAKTEQEKIEQENKKKAKAGAAAAAAGLGSAGISAPKTVEKPLTQEDYLKNKRAAKERTKTISPV